MQALSSTFRGTAFAVRLQAMLRKLMWTALYGVLGAAATMAARRAASRIWRVATGEEPPVKQK
jgi:hypothetical protein